MNHTQRRFFAIYFLFITAIGLASQGWGESPSDEILYNGIHLPSPWPPNLPPPNGTPMDIPYLKNPPDEIPINVGRQLFVDDFLIESTNLKREFHEPVYAKENPILKPDQPWEQTGRSPTAEVFSDGVWFDPHDQIFKMWYMCGYTVAVCYATSSDGIHWKKPNLDVEKGTNIVYPGPRNSVTVWLDQETKDPDQRFKLFQSDEKPFWLSVHFSPDGIHWSGAKLHTGPADDPRSTAFYNPFRKVWAFSVRSDATIAGAPRRARRYSENHSLFQAAQWKDYPGWWIGADQLDKPDPKLNERPQLYNLDAFPYESLMVGLITIWRGAYSDRPKFNEVYLGFSRDGFHWDRANRTPFLRVSDQKEAWNWGNVQSAGGGCLIVGNNLYFYCSGQTGGKGNWEGGASSTGLAILRRDGFASMHAGETGTLITRPVTFRGKHLFVNYKAVLGSLKVEILDENNHVIPAHSEDQCLPLSGDKTLAEVQWKGVESMWKLVNKPVRFKFYLSRGDLYSFWVSQNSDGASLGYVAAGGPKFQGPKDTLGQFTPGKN